MENPSAVPSAVPVNKIQLAGEIGRVETELSQLESSLREKERQLQSVKGNRTAGAAALLIGIILFLFVNIYLGVFLGLIGFLTLITAIGKQGPAQAAIKAVEGQIAEKRGKLAEMRAQLAVL